MECQKITNLLDNTPNQPSKFRTEKWVEIKDDSRVTYNTNSLIKFKTSMLNSSLCDYSNAYIPVKGTISVAATIGAATNDNNIKIISKNCVSITDFISKMNNTQIDNAKDIDVVMPVYNLI